MSLFATNTSNLFPYAGVHRQSKKILQYKDKKMTALRQSTAPTLIMETSWEVCNKVGGIYAVLSTRAATMVESYGRDAVLFVGPFRRHFRQEDVRLDSEEPDSVLSRLCGLPTYLGTWLVPGEPRVALVDFQPLYAERDLIYYDMWEDYRLSSESGYGDYDESCLFATASARVMKAYSTLHGSERPVAIFNEWTTGMGLLWLKKNAPDLPTIFITHATTVGRSISGNNKELYKYMTGYHGDQMARELGVVAKHAVEKKAAHEATVFCTVSEVTAVECAQLLERPVDVVTKNGFEPDFVPSDNKRSLLRAEGRKKLLNIARTLYGAKISDDASIILSSGRFEYRNKGLDLFVDALARIPSATTDILPIIAVPAWVKEPRPEIRLGLNSDRQLSLPAKQPYCTHWLNDQDSNILIRQLDRLRHTWGKHVYPLFIPAYLDGHDGILDIRYYDLLPAIDLTVFASYYEPWGYTPLESIAFGIPTVTTDKAGFGLWARSLVNTDTLNSGVLVLDRSDDNYDDVANQLAQTIQNYSQAPDSLKETAHQNAQKLASQADWKHFFQDYRQAFELALNNHPKAH